VNVKQGYVHYKTTFIDISFTKCEGALRIKCSMNDM
jgi:hypothetical protein